MEKEAQPDSMTTVTIKPDYPPSEVYSSEPPPAYHRSQSSAVQVAKIIGITVVLMSVVLGSFILASAYVTANASCRQLEQELELLSEAADRFQAPLQPEALVQKEVHRTKQQTDQQQEESRKNVNEVESNSIDSDNSDSSSDSNSDNNSESEEEEEERPIHFKLPLQLDFDDLAGALIEKNQKSKMNCIVEKKRAEEVVDHQPKTLRLPFGLNLTTDPRYERVSGERMAIFCESGNVQKQSPAEDDEEETIMIQPVMIPIPQTHFPTHMAQQMRPVQQSVQQQYHPMETMRPPMPPVVQQEQNQFPPNQILHHIAQQIIAQKIMEARQAREEQQNQEAQPNEEIMAQRIPVPEEVLTQLNRLPNRDVIVTVSRQEPEEVPQEAQEMRVDGQEMRIIPQEVRIIPQEMRTVQQEMRALPQEVRPVHQEMRPVHQEMGPVHQEMRPVHQEMRPVHQEMRPVHQEMRPVHQEMRPVPQMMNTMQEAPAIPQVSEEVHVMQQQRENAQEVNGRQAYARGLPVHIPVHMIQQQEEPQAAPAEESRPHYVQPRSVRSVDAVLAKSQKRVKRCSCDCAC